MPRRRMPCCATIHPFTIDRRDDCRTTSADRHCREEEYEDSEPESDVDDEEDDEAGDGKDAEAPRKKIIQFICRRQPI